MPRLIERPAVVEAVGNKPKRIEEYVGRVNSGHPHVSVARMRSPAGWEEPGQRPEFEEVTVVLTGTLRVEHASGVLDVHAGQAVVVAPGEWVRYSSPGEGGPSTSRSVCRRSHREPFTETTTPDGSVAGPPCEEAPIQAASPRSWKRDSSPACPARSGSSP